jgi:hypothetical protein
MCDSMPATLDATARTRVASFMRRIRQHKMGQSSIDLVADEERLRDEFAHRHVPLLDVETAIAYAYAHA